MWRKAILNPSELKPITAVGFFMMIIIIFTVDVDLKFPDLYACGVRGAGSALDSCKEIQLLT